MPSLDFHQHNSTWGTHGLHAFAAKFPPQLARYGIRYYSRRGELIVDPMMGSGTSLVEARVLGRHAIGYDIDPLARLMAKVKSTPIDTNLMQSISNTVLAAVCKDLDHLALPNSSFETKKRGELPDFNNRDYWFLPQVSTSLALLSFHIKNTPMSDDIRDFLWVVFSSLILAKHSVANARDIIHSRHHFLEHANAPDVIKRYSDRLKRTSKQMDEFIKRLNSKNSVEITATLGDARDLTLDDRSVDLVITSPPYATALDYPRAHFLAVAWMERCFGLTLQEYMSNASQYIGTERGRIGSIFQLNQDLASDQLTKKILDLLAQESPRQANLVQRYFIDMKQVLSKISHVLKVKRHAIVVVCPSHLRKVEIPTHEVFIEFGKELGLKAKHVHVRKIATNRRILPYVKESFGDRMSTEYVLIFQRT